MRSPAKLATSDNVTKLKTIVLPSRPLNDLGEIPPMVGMAMGEPVEEMGPATPGVASQTMISWDAEAQA